MAIWNDIFKKILRPIVDESIKDKKGAAIEKAIFAQQVPMGVGPIDSSNTVAKLFSRGISFDVLRNFSLYYPILRSCFVSDTPVITSSGATPIQSIKIGDKVLTHNGRWKKVTEIFNNPYKGSLYSIKRFGSNIPFVCTPEHPFLTVKIASQKSKNYKTVWKTASELNKDDYLLLPRLKEKVDRKVINLNYLYHKVEKRRLLKVNKHLLNLIGWYLAEGSVNDYTVFFTLNSKEKNEANEIVRNAKKIFRLKTGTNIRLLHNGTTQSVEIYSKAAVTFFLQFGRGAENKFIPSWVLDLPDFKLKKVIKAMWRGDGCISKESYLYDTVSQALCFDYVVALNKIGIASTVYKSDGKYPRLPIYRVGAYGKHAIKFGELLLNDNEKVKMNNHRFSHKFNLIDKDYAYTKVKSIEYLPNRLENVFNLEVADDNSYTAYGVVSHNCINYRKRQISQLDWNIAVKEVTTDKTKKDKYKKDAKEVHDLFMYPTGDRTVTFMTFVSKILEDLFVLDAISIYRRKNRRGGNYGYLPVDASTISLVLYKDGTTPQPPDYAYIQKINGQTVAELTTDDMIYRSINPRTNSPYGLSSVEALIIVVTTALKLSSYNLAYLCYDEETEVLTQDGWKRFKELDKDDFLATRNKKGNFEWQKPTNRYVFDYNDKLVKFKSSTVDLFVTPNHRMLVDYRGSHGKFVEKNIIKRADWFIKEDKSKTQNYLAPTTSVWVGETPEFFELEEYVVVRNGIFSGYAFKGRDKNNKPVRNNKKFITDTKTIEYKKEAIKIPIKDWVAFFGLYLAEGWVRKENSQSKHDVYISQSKESVHWKEIQELLLKLPFKFKWQEKNTVFVASNAVLWQYLRRFGHSYNKYIPTEVKNYSSDLLKILWEWAIKGDGHITKDGFNVYTTVSEKLAGDYQEVLQKIGKEGRVSVCYQDIGRIISEGKSPVKTTVPIYKVFERVSTHRSLSCASEEHYAGKVYSVKVSNGIVYIRRNGLPLWCGNTEGNVPEGFVELPRDIASDPDQLTQWQNAWDTMFAGDPKFQRKIKFLPEGMKWSPIKKIGDMEFERFEKWLLLNTCFDEKTEVLTNNGWKLFKDLNRENDTVITRNAYGDIEYQKPSAYQSFAYSGKMISFNNKMVDLLVTPDHNMLTTYNHGVERKFSDYKFERADDLVGKDGHLSPLSANPTNNKNSQSFHLDGIDYLIPNVDKTYRKAKSNPIDCNSNDFARFLGLWFADGWARGSKGGKNPGTKNGKSLGYTVGISTKEENKMERVETILNKLPLKWRKTETSYLVSNMTLWKYLSDFGNVYTKRIPRDILSYSGKFLKAFWDGFVLGDGYISPSGQQVIISCNYSLLGDFQELLLKIGLSGSIRIHNNDGQLFAIRGKEYRSSETYIMTARKSQHTQLNAKEEDYTGMVYDVTVPNHTLYVRRNGKPMWSGNCSLMEVPPQAIGFQFDRGKGATEAEWEIGKERGLFPTAHLLKEVFDEIIQEDLGQDHLEFVWTNINPTNKKEEAQVFETLVRNGAVSVDEWRIGEGLDPIGLSHFIMTPLGPYLVKDMVNRPAGGNPNQPYAPALPNVAVPEKPQTSPGVNGKPAKPQTNVAPANNTEQKIAAKMRQDNIEIVVEELRKWKKSAINDLKQGKSYRDFQTDVVDYRTQKIIKDALKNAKTREEINDLFDPFIDQENSVIASMLELYTEINNIIEKDHASN